MSGAQRLSEPVNRTDLSVDPVDYFGVAPERTENAALFGLDPSGPEEDLYRVSYLFLLVYSKEDEYGGMQLRAETQIYAEDGSPPVRLSKLIQRTAHRAANMYDTSVETPAYGENEWASGYLSGFDPWENAASYENWEIEPVSGQEARNHGTVGKINWTTEIYNEVEGTHYAQLAGKASGIANPWTHTTTEEEGREAVNVAPHKWEIGFEESRDPPEYFLRPPGGTNAAKRYVSGAGVGKDVYVNDHKVGGLGPKGRVWMRGEYNTKDGLTWGENHSKKGLVKKTKAHPNSLKTNVYLRHVGETEDAVYLRTANDLPDGYRPADPDDVSPTLEVTSGREGRTIHLLGLIDIDDPIPCECREDRKVIDKMGKSAPPYRHGMDTSFKWPGDRRIKPLNIGGQTGVGDPDAWDGVNRADVDMNPDDLDDSQDTLDGYGGDR